VPTRILTWAQDVLTKCVDIKLAGPSLVQDWSRVLTRADGKALADLTRYFSEPEKRLADLYDPGLLRVY
jgi:hypothetical protein